MTQQEKRAKVDTIIARMLMSDEGIPKNIAERAISVHLAQANSVEAVSPEPQDKNAKIAAIIDSMVNSVPTKILNIAKELQESESKPMGYRVEREPDASWYRPSYHRPPSQSTHPNTYEQAAYEKRNKESLSLGLQPFWNIIDRIRRNNRRLIEKDEIDRMCREHGLNFESLSKEEKAEFLDKCVP